MNKANRKDLKKGGKLYVNLVRLYFVISFPNIKFSKAENEGCINKIKQGQTEKENDDKKLFHFTINF